VKQAVRQTKRKHKQAETDIPLKSQSHLFHFLSHRTAPHRTATHPNPMPPPPTSDTKPPKRQPHLNNHALSPNRTHHQSPLLLPLPPLLHRHLPRPQRLRQPTRQTDIARTPRRIPPTATATLRTPVRRAHADGTVPRRRRR